MNNKTGKGYNDDDNMREGIVSHPEYGDSIWDDPLTVAAHFQKEAERLKNEIEQIKAEAVFVMPDVARALKAAIAIKGGIDEMMPWRPCKEAWASSAMAWRVLLEEVITAIGGASEILVELSGNEEPHRATVRDGDDLGY